MVKFTLAGLKDYRFCIVVLIADQLNGSRVIGPRLTGSQTLLIYSAS